MTNDNVKIIESIESVDGRIDLPVTIRKVNWPKLCRDNPNRWINLISTDRVVMSMYISAEVEITAYMTAREICRTIDDMRLTITAYSITTNGGSDVHEQ